MDVPSEQRESRDRSASARGNKVTAAGPHSDSSGLRPPAAGPVDVPPAPRADSSREATEGRTLSAPEPSTAVNSSSEPEIPAAACEPTPIPRTPSPAPAKEPFAASNPAAHNPRTINTSAAFVSNSSEINTSETRLFTSQKQQRGCISAPEAQGFMYHTKAAQAGEVFYDRVSCRVRPESPSNCMYRG
jgi:hypothetical protein